MAEKESSLGVYEAFNGPGESPILFVDGREWRGHGVSWGLMMSPEPHLVVAGDEMRKAVESGLPFVTMIHSFDELGGSWIGCPCHRYQVEFLFDGDAQTLALKRHSDDLW